MSLLIRRATSVDAAQLAELAAATFPLAAPADALRSDLDAFIAANLSEERFRGISRTRHASCSSPWSTE